jgi:hypothetical protein
LRIKDELGREAWAAVGAAWDATAWSARWEMLPGFDVVALEPRARAFYWGMPPDLPRRKGACRHGQN